MIFLLLFIYINKTIDESSIVDMGKKKENKKGINKIFIL